MDQEQMHIVEALKNLLTKAEEGKVSSLRFVAETDTNINVGQYAIVPASVAVVGSLEMLHKDCLERLVSEFRSKDNATEKR